MHQVNAVVRNFTGASQWCEQRCMALVGPILAFCIFISLTFLVFDIHQRIPVNFEPIFKVSLETEGEWVEVRRRMESWKAPFIWTSGHICDK